MRARLDIGETEESMDKALKVLRAIFILIDKVVRINLSEQARSKCEKNRKKTQAAKAKEVDEGKEQEIIEKAR